MEFTGRANTKYRPSPYLRPYHFYCSGFRAIVGANLVFARKMVKIAFSDSLLEKNLQFDR
jgi:hypothetical protein